MTGIVPPPQPVSALPAVVARSSPNPFTKPFMLPLGQAPAPGTYAGTMRVDAATGHVLFVGQALKLVLPSTAMASPAAAVPAVLRVLVDARDGQVRAQLLPTASPPPPQGRPASATPGPAVQPRAESGPALAPTYGPPTSRPSASSPSPAPPLAAPIAAGPPPPSAPRVPAAPPAATPPTLSGPAPAIGPSWQPTALAASSSPLPLPAIVPFTPPSLTTSTPDPVAAEVAARVGGLARLGEAKLGPARGQRLLALSDQLPTSLPAVAYDPTTGPLRRLVVAVGDPPPETTEGPPRRLVLEIELARLGRIRLDGLADQGRFDVLLAGVPAEVRPSLRALWSMVVQRTGLVGDLGFHDGAGA